MFFLKINKSLNYKLFIQPLFEQRKKLVILMFSLCVLSFLQVFLALFVDPLMRSLFLSTEKSVVSLSDFLPKNIFFLSSSLKEVKFSLHSLPYIISISLLITAVLRSLSLFTYQLSSTALSLWVGKNYREHLFRKILNLSYLKICLKTPAEWMSHLMADVLQLQLRFSVLNNLIRDSFIIIIALGSLFLIHMPSGVFFIVWL